MKSGLVEDQFIDSDYLYTEDALFANIYYEDVVAEARDRFDPLIDLSNPELVPLDDLAGLELVRGWRELVWRNAERLLNAKNKQEQRQVAKSIEDQAALAAQVIAAAGLP